MVVLDERVIGEADNLLIETEGITPEDIEELYKAKFIKLIRPGKASTPTEMARNFNERVEVPLARFSEMMEQNWDHDYVLPLKGWQIGIIHGLVALAADHPGVKGMTKETQAAIRRVRDWCKAVFIDWGFSPEEALYLDTMRIDKQGNVGPEDETKKEE